ncbi:hypothetical protein ACTQ5K_22385 [Niallia sp. Sow4_A1]|uniref:hypothetical protein n=1 Tax=unclassified Niallia TaxID=2837522 RepID=UPI003F8BBD73
MKKILLLLSLIFIFGFTLVGCSQDVQHNKSLEKAIYSVVKDKNSTEIELKSLTDFSWDKAFLFQPYSAQEDMSEKMGVNFKDPSKLDYRDDIYLLVFLNKDKVVQYAEIDRQGSNFNIEDEYLTKENSKIMIKR